jgi:hypothetical protein
MKIISVIEDESVERLEVERDRRARPPLKAAGPPEVPEYGISFPKGSEYPVVNRQSLSFQHYKL